MVAFEASPEVSRTPIGKKIRRCAAAHESGRSRGSMLVVSNRTATRPREHICGLARARSQVCALVLVAQAPDS